MKIQFNSRQTGIWIIALTLCASAANAGLTHRYSFKGDTKDSVGKVDGKLKGAASVADGKLVLKNDTMTSNDEKLSYLEFAGPLFGKDAKSVTFVFWFTAKDTAGYARLLNIGDHEGGEGRAFIYVTPRTADGNSRAAITATDVGGRIPLDNEPLDDGKVHMMAIVIDGSANKMHVYIDGKEPKPAEDLGENTLDKVRTADNFIGRSSFDADPGLTASIDEFRVYDSALSAAEITAAEKAGADALPTK